MVWRMAMLRSAGRNIGCTLGFRRDYTCIIAQPPPLDIGAVKPRFVLPELDLSPKIGNKGIGFDFPSFSFGAGSMELMAVPKRKVSPHKRGIRSGPKALRPVPVIVRCKACGRVKLPHFFCCSGLRGNTDERNGSTS